MRRALGRVPLLRGIPMHRHSSTRRWITAAAAAALGLGAAWSAWHGAAPARADLTERPGNSLDDPIDVPHDLSGLSVKTPRVRIVHTTDPSKPGGSMYLQLADPWLGYQWGRDLIQREFRDRDGVYADNNGRLDGPLLPDG